MKEAEPMNRNRRSIAVTYASSVLTDRKASRLTVRKKTLGQKVSFNLHTDRKASGLTVRKVCRLMKKISLLYNPLWWVMKKV